MKRVQNKKAKDAIKKLKDASLKVGWFKGIQAENGTPISKIAYVQNYGCVINHPGGTAYFIGENGQPQFVSNDKAKGLPRTKPHTIVIPPRPFMDNAKNDNQNEWIKTVYSEFQKVFNGEQPVINALTRLGFVVQGDIKKSISTISSPPLKASTVRAKRNRMANKKATGSLNKPLVDTGVMVNSVDFEAIY